MKVEQPPELWEPDTEDVRLLPLLGEMISSGLVGGSELSELTLNASNVVVGPPDDGETMVAPQPGEYVALTVVGATDFGPDDSWHPASQPGKGLLQRLRERLGTAGARYAYIRRLPPQGSFTVFFARVLPPH
jgi:hypothetical protein